MAEVLFSRKNHTLAAGEEISLFSTFPVWQVLIIVGVISWLYVARLSLLTVRLRSILQPYVMRHVNESVPFLVRLQGAQNPTLDLFLSSLSYSVSVEFYTTFLPLLFWAGYPKMARNMVLLMALCIYLGNCLKDIVSAPRPPSPPVRKLLATHAEAESAQEYGLPSSHTINSLCLAGFLLYDLNERGVSTLPVATLVGVLVVGVVYGRLYLGMHSPVDVIAGAVMGVGILTFWCSIEKSLDAFIAHGENVPSFWAAIAVLLLFAYPSPERRNPSFEFHTAFNGVAFGVVAGVHRTYALYHHDAVKGLPLRSLAGLQTLFLRLVVGLPLCLAVKAVAKEVAIRILPSVCNLLGLQIRSSGYIQAFHIDEISLKEKRASNGKDGPSAVDSRRSGYILRFLQTFEDEILDVDTGIRALQYAGLGWSVFELAPLVFSYLNL